MCPVPTYSHAVSHTFSQRADIIFDVAPLAQLVEHLTCNQVVASSIPAGGTTRYIASEDVSFKLNEGD